MQQPEINLIIIIAAQIILTIIITKTFLSSSDKKEFATKTIIIIIILLGLSLAFIAAHNKPAPIPEQKPIQSTINNLQESSRTQKAIPQSQNTEKDKKDPSENQQPSPSEPQKNTTQEIINKIEKREKYIIITNQYAQTLNTFLETHDYKKVATTPDGNLYEYQRPHFGW